MFDKVLLFLKFFDIHYYINIINEKYSSELVSNSDIIFSDNNYEILEKIFSYFQTRTAYNPYISKLFIESLGNNGEKLFSHLSFLNIGYLKYDMNLALLKGFQIKHLDLSSTQLVDISGICDITKIKILNLSYNQHIKNLNVLKDAKCVNLQELYLSNNDIEDLDEIEMKKYKFSELKVLDLSSNMIQDLTPVKYAFKYLKELNVYNNPLKRNFVLYEIKKQTPSVNIISNYGWNVV